MKRLPLFCLCLALTALLVGRRSGRPGSESAPTPPRTDSLPLSRAPAADRPPKPEEILAMPSLPPSREARWQTPSDLEPMAAFQAWTKEYAAQPTAAAAAEGLRLAAARRVALRELIRQDPELALAQAVPEQVRRSVPAGVRALLEDPVDGRGDLIATAASGGRVPKGRRAVYTGARLADGRRFEAFVYGNREFQPSRADVPIHGIAIDGALAVDQWPGRVLDSLEAAEAKLSLGAEPECPTSGQNVSSTGTEIALLSGTETTFFCGPAHAQRVLAEEAAAEALRPPGLGVRRRDSIDAASGGAGQTVPSLLGEGDHAWTTGTKRILVARVKFQGYADTLVDYTDLTSQDCESIVSGIRAAFADWSYGRLNVLPVQSGGSRVSPIIHLERRASEYEGDEIGDIWDEVRDSVADDYGIDPDDYDFLLVLAGDAPITDEDDDTKVVWWAGLGRIGEGLAFVRVNDGTWTDQERIDKNVRVSLHEIGHNLGLAHASNRFSSPQSVNGALSLGDEYGDRYDTMGHGGIGQDYNVRYKQWLNWLDNANVPYANTDGVYTIREHDLEEKSGLRGLQVAPEPVLLPFTGANQLFIEYRLNPVEASGTNRYYPYTFPLHAWGAQIRLGKPGSPKTWLLDASPETPNWEPITPGQEDGDPSGNLDSPLLPGRTLSYSRNGNTVYITNLRADPEAGELTLEIQHGPIAGNNPPAGSIAANTPQAAPHQTVVFTANVTDPEDNELAYHWQLPQFNLDTTTPAVFSNARSIPVTFTATGTWTVKCLVSDKHGGTTALTRNFSVVQNQPPVISAIASKTTNEDAPLLNIPFTVSDPTTPAGSLTVSVSSDNTSLFPAGSLDLGGSGANRTLSLTPAANRHGHAEVTVAVSDGVLHDVTTFTVTVEPVTPGTTLVASHGSWRYYDDSSAPPATWADPDFDDSLWNSGAARFVYPAPLINFGGWTVLNTPASARPACYFRRTFTVPALAEGTPVLRFLCDDGLVVSVNGAEVWRHNMPDGILSHATRALSTVGGAKQQEWVTVPLKGLQFRSGLNSIAASVHDVGGTRGAGDVTFDLQLALLQTPTISRLASHSSPEDQPAGPYSFTASEAESPSGGVTMTAVSSNPSLLLDSSIQFGFNVFTQTRTITCVPQPDATGTTEITVKASDGSSETWQTFTLTVTPVNDPPVIEPVPDLAVALGEPAPLVEITVADVDGDPAALTVTATSGNAALLPAAGIEVLPGPAANRRWLRLTSNPGVAAQAAVTVIVSDGTASRSDTFTFRVSPPLSVTGTDVTLVRSGEAWRYWAGPLPLDPRGNPVDFTDPALDDRAWTSGPSPLGYGNAGLATSVPATPYRVTTYFRKKFTVPNAAAATQLKLRLLRDDGAVVHLNGTPVWSSNMPRGVATAATLAATDIAGTAEQAWQTQTISTASLRSGLNTIAVELHQSALPSGFAPGDLGFDLEIDGVPATPAAADVLVAPGDAWSYWDQPTYPDDTWRLATFVEDGWKQGLARLGYGIGGESTVVNADNEAGTGRLPCVLFRRVFDIADPAAYASLHLFTQHDDGIAVHLNGVRVHLRNLAATASPGDFALAEITAPEQTQWNHVLIDPKRLIPGRNLLAVEVHQASLAGTDLNFDLQLTGEITGTPPLFIRPTGASVELSWPAAYAGWVLRSSAGLDLWSPSASSPLLEGAWMYVRDPVAGPSRFYRLEKP